MRVLKIDMVAALQIGRGEPKERLTAETDDVAIEVQGDWVVIRETKPQREKPPRTVCIHASRVKYLEVDPRDVPGVHKAR